MTEERAAVGLCFTCRHSRAVTTPRARYWLCRLAARDPRFEKYPRLPMLSCPGYEPREEARAPGADEER